MKSLIVTGPGTVEFLDVEEPTAGPRDVVIAPKACGICGSDVFYAHRGGIPPRDGHTPLGHEIAGEVVGIGKDVAGVAVGDHIVINPMANADGIIGNGGAQGGLSERVVLLDAKAGVHFRIIPAELPWEIAALNEPMAVAYHGVNRSGAGEGSKVVVFGAGPVGLGAAIGFKDKGAEHVVVVDVVPNRLEKALRVGADAVINSAEEDVVERLKSLHGEVPGFMGQGSKAATDIYFDAAGAPIVIETAFKAMRNRGVLTIVAVHKKPVELDFQELLTIEPDIRLAMGYPTEIFEVTDSIIEHWDKYQHIISDVIPFTEAVKAVELAATPGATDKVVVIFE
ncbi:zinc-dependent alcohol dehydrogenase [Arthrobacter sp. B2a2-09]|uniref:zinc-dependent alcohol dehydrogenase n=1 Tax=Arthrobacter sp. B2a2-09 TaxID=2952822 RepID=UPI0022CD33AD|nr:zinc-binding dehydrogenase [Arthrobacter sp. B2a2-09]MCZ9881981.1 zinc-binding dehydrogenase [Arthrobacter sp. B2a2-09]